MGNLRKKNPMMKVGFMTLRDLQKLEERIIVLENEINGSHLELHKIEANHTTRIIILINKTNERIDKLKESIERDRKDQWKIISEMAKKHGVRI